MRSRWENREILVNLAEVVDKTMGAVMNLARAAGK